MRFRSLSVVTHGFWFSTVISNPCFQIIWGQAATEQWIIQYQLFTWKETKGWNQNDVGAFTKNNLIENHVFWITAGKWRHKFLTCGETHYGSAVFVCPDLLLFGNSNIKCQDHNDFHTVRACARGMLRYCQIASIWKLIQHCVHPFWSPVSAAWLLRFTWHPKSRQEQRELH